MCVYKDKITNKFYCINCKKYLDENIRRYFLEDLLDKYFR